MKYYLHASRAVAELIYLVKIIRLMQNLCLGLELRHPTGVVQKFKKLSETPATAPMIAKLCMNDCKNREIAEKLV